MFRKLIGFIFPFTRIISSEYNGKLELTTIFGKTYLNTVNTNYSYGSLQKVLKYALKQVDLTSANHILVLGLGGGSVLKTLRSSFNFTGRITAVDIDPVIIDIARNEFNVFSNENTFIVCADAKEYLKNNNDEFDIIIIDLFIDNHIPAGFLSEAFWHDVVRCVSKDGTIIFNMLCSPPSDIQNIENELKNQGFSWKIFRKVERTNNVLIASGAG